MNNLKASLSKFLGNKNTVTILGVALCLIILAIGYNYQISSRVTLERVPVAVQTIQPRTQITDEMLQYVEVPKSFLVGDYYEKENMIIGKYSTYNSIIAKGSLFYKELVVDEDDLPDSAFGDIPSGYTVIIYPVDIYTTYANSMTPGSYINIYYKSLNDDNKVMFGKFVSMVKVLDIKDASGRHVFENAEEDRVPAYMLFAVPEETHLLLRKALYLEDEYDVELLFIPHTEEYDPTKNYDVKVSSQEIAEFINEKTDFVSIDELPDFNDQNNGQVTPEEDTDEE